MSIQYLLFSVGTRKLAVNAVYVQEVFSLSHLTRIPVAPSFLSWVVSWQNSIIPVLDLSLFISQRSKTILESYSSLIIQNGDISSAFALVIDDIHGVVSVKDNEQSESELLPYFAEGSLLHENTKIWIISPDKLSRFVISQFDISF